MIVAQSELKRGDTLSCVKPQTPNPIFPTDFCSLDIYNTTYELFALKYNNKTYYEEYKHTTSLTELIKHQDGCSSQTFKGLIHTKIFSNLPESYYIF